MDRSRGVSPHRPRVAPSESCPAGYRAAHRWVGALAAPESSHAAIAAATETASAAIVPRARARARAPPGSETMTRHPRWFNPAPLLHSHFTNSATCATVAGRYSDVDVSGSPIGDHPEPGVDPSRAQHVAQQAQQAPKVTNRNRLLLAQFSVVARYTTSYFSCLLRSVAQHVALPRFVRGRDDPSMYRRATVAQHRFPPHPPYVRRRTNVGNRGGCDPRTPIEERPRMGGSG